jgi:hypothetical protein
MSKVTDVRVVDRQEAAGLPELSDELRVAVTDIAATAREGVVGDVGRGGSAGDG